MEAIKNITYLVARKFNTPSDRCIKPFWEAIKVVTTADTIYQTLDSPAWPEMNWEPRYITFFFPRNCDTSEFKLTLYQN